MNGELDTTYSRKSLEKQRSEAMPQWNLIHIVYSISFTQLIMHGVRHFTFVIIEICH